MCGTVTINELSMNQTNKKLDLFDLIRNYVCIHVFVYVHLAIIMYFFPSIFLYKK